LSLQDCHILAVPEALTTKLKLCADGSRDILIAQLLRLGRAHRHYSSLSGLFSYVTYAGGVSHIALN
jgi:hypothetical protein